MFIGFGILAILVATNYPMGSAQRMGPGYFPTLIGIGLIILGALIVIPSFKQYGEGIGRWPWRAILFLTLGFIAFAWGIEALGFIPAMLILIVTSALAGGEARWKEVVAESVIMIAGCWAIFIWALELPFPLFGGR
jgi:putative tricarboxylic transport membrane protein